MEELVPLSLMWWGTINSFESISGLSYGRFWTYRARDLGLKADLLSSIILSLCWLPAGLRLSPATLFDHLAQFLSTLLLKIIEKLNLAWCEELEVLLMILLTDVEDSLREGKLELEVLTHLVLRQFYGLAIDLSCTDAGILLAGIAHLLGIQDIEFSKVPGIIVGELHDLYQVVWTLFLPEFLLPLLLMSMLVSKYRGGSCKEKEEAEKVGKKMFHWGFFRFLGVLKTHRILRVPSVSEEGEHRAWHRS